MHENDFFNEDLLCALAGVAGEDNVLMSEPMREHTTFKIGGPADVFVTPDTEQGLVATLDTCYRCDLPLTIVGNGSDLLVGDKGIRGVVVALGEGLSDITVDGTHVTAAAGALLSDVAAAAAEAGLTGMEPISGIPGSVGGACMDDYRQRREDKQPLDMPSAGSTFKRPEGYFAGKLIMDAGLRGHAVGGAQVSEKHCGFIVNANHATAADVDELIRDIQAKVKEQFDVDLEPEVHRVGEFL